MIYNIGQNIIGCLIAAFFINLSMKVKIYLIAIITLSAMFIHSCKQQKQQITTVEQAIKFDSDSINKICPKWLDKDSLVEVLNSSILPNNTLRINYLLNIDSAKIDIPKIKHRLREVKLKDMSKNPTFRALLQINATIEYSYVDKYNKFLFVLDYKKEDISY